MPAPSPGVLPRPRDLAALGAVLCLYRAQSGGELGGWAQAVRATSCSSVDSDGLRERVLFFDRDGRCCWRLCLLPDSDFLAWERMAARLPASTEADAPGSIGERLWRRLAGRVHGERWQGSILRLHALAAAPGFGLSPPPVLAASLAPLSTLGAAAARRIAHGEGADSEGIVVDDCCCRRAAAAGNSTAAATGDGVFPLIRFNLGAQA